MRHHLIGLARAAGILAVALAAWLAFLQATGAVSITPLTGECQPQAPNPQALPAAPPRTPPAAPGTTPAPGGGSEPPATPPSPAPAAPAAPR